MEVYWLEQRERDVPPPEGSLSADELLQLGRLRFEKRRADWVLGRWTAKLAVSSYLHIPRRAALLREIEVRPEPSGAPEVWIGSRPAPVTISLSHRGGAALCAVAMRGVELGCDLELAEPRSPAFLSDWFTEEERSFVEQAPAPERTRLLALLWSAKESVLKALRLGLRLDTRSAAVAPVASPASDPAAWSPLRVSCQNRIFEGWWRQTAGLVRTIVAAPAPHPPVRL
jgi:4'-phosphopantetheinyl transferase